MSRYNSDLGTFLSRYTAPREDFYKSLLIFVVVFGGAISFILVLTSLIALTERLLDVLIIGAVILALIAYPVWRLIKFAIRLFTVRTIVFYSDGFEIRESDHIQPVRWDEIDTYYIRAQRLGVDYLRDSDAAQVSARLNFVLLIQLQNGEKLEIESAVLQMKYIANIIGRQVALHQLPRIRQRIDSHGSYNFGRLTVEQDRLTAGEIGFRWYQMQRVTFSYADAMVIEQRGAPRPRPVIPLSQIPNVHALMLLLHPHAEIIDMENHRVDPATWTNKSSIDA